MTKEQAKKCPTCKKIAGFHYTYTTHDGVFCDKQCADAFKDPKLSKKQEVKQRIYHSGYF